MLLIKFNPNKTPIDITKEEKFGRTYFREIYLGVNGKWNTNSWKELNELKTIDQKYYSSGYYDVKLNKYKVKIGTSLRIWGN